MSRTFLIALCVTGVLVAALAFVGDATGWPAPENPPYQGEAVDATSLASSPMHAPRALARLVREPQNTWSNLAFVLGGAFLLATAAQRITRGTGVALIAVGMGSFLYHASAAATLRHLDVAAMYWLFLMATALCCSALARRWRSHIERHAVPVTVGSCLLAAVMAAARNVTVLGVKPLSVQFATAMAAAIVILCLAEIVRRLESISAALQLLGIVTLFGMAAACQTFDRPGGPLYNPAALIQAHAVWHVLAATTFVWSAQLLDRAAARPASDSR